MYNFSIFRAREKSTYFLKIILLVFSQLKLIYNYKITLLNSKIVHQSPINNIHYKCYANDNIKKNIKHVPYTLYIKLHCVLI